MISMGQADLGSKKFQLTERQLIRLRFGSSGRSIWTSYTSFESSWPADFDYLSFGSIP